MRCGSFASAVTLNKIARRLGPLSAGQMLNDVETGVLAVCILQAHVDAGSISMRQAVLAVLLTAN
jgi:hypothetical protein